MNLTKVYAKILGFYLVIISLGTLIKPAEVQMFTTSMVDNKIMMVLGIVALIVGLVILVTHHIWEGWPLVVTLFGVLITIKGFMLIFYPEYMTKMVGDIGHGSPTMLLFIIELVIGLLLLVLGFKART